MGGSTDLAALWQAVSLDWIFAVVVTLLMSGALVLCARRPEWIIGRPWIVLAVVGAVSLGAVLALFRFDPPRLNLVLDPSTEPLLPRRDPGQELYRSAVLDFGDDEVYVVAVECEEVFEPGCLEAIDQVSTKIAKLPEVRSISSLMDVTSFRYMPADDWVEVRPFIEDVPTDPTELASLRERALGDPVYVRSIVSEDARTAAINIYFQKMTDAELIDGRLDERVSEILAGEPSLAGHHFFVSGRPHFKTHVYNGMVRDLRVLLPLSIATMVLVLWIFTGTLRGVLIPLAVALGSVLWTFGAIAFLGRSLTLLTGLVGPMLLAMGCVYGVHVVTSYQEDAAEARSSPEASLEGLRHLIVPTTISGLTTVIGFASLLITDVPAVFDLGAFSMLGVGAMALLSLTAAPAALALMPLRVAPRAAFSGRLGAWLDVALVRLSERVTRFSRTVLVSSAVVVAVTSAFIPFIVIDTDYLSYFDEDDPVRVDFEAVNERLSGAVPLYIVLDGPEPGVFREPAAVAAIEEIQRRVDGIEGVSRSLSFAESMRMLNRAFNSDDPAEERIPETRAGVTELLFMIPKNELQRSTTVNHGRANVILRTGEVGSSHLLRLVHAVEQQLAEVDLPLGIKARVTGNALLLARSADGIASGQPLSVTLAAVTILALVAIGLRSLGIGAVAMVPNITPVLIYFGLLGMGAAPLSLPTSLIACISLGITTDDTVHYVVRYRGERRRGAAQREAALRTTRSVGRSVVITSAVISLGFLVVVLSGFATLREFGGLSALTMGICLICDLVMLPALLVRTRL